LKAHIDYVYSKLLKFIGFKKNKLRWKVSFSVLKIILCLVHPHLLYGIEVYANSSLNHLNKVMILNNKLLAHSTEQITENSCN